MKRILLSGVCGLFLMSNIAQADDQGQWYGGLEGYVSKLGKEKTSGGTLDLNNHFKSGLGFAGNFGYDYGKMRLEIEIGKHFHKADRFAVINDGGLGFGSSDASSGKSNLTHYMVNAIIDLGNPFKSSKFEPFIGAGLGAATMKWSNLTPSSLGTAYVGGSDTGMAYQGFAGIRMPVSDKLDFSVKYRYMATNDANLLDQLNRNTKSSYDVHDFIFGITYRFGGQKTGKIDKRPQPIAQPALIQQPVVKTPQTPKLASAPEPIQINKGPYSVYFDWDSSEITLQAGKVITSAASEAKKGNNITIGLSGHADRSGANSYNDTLSYARAIMVQSALVKGGIDASKISIQSYGELNGEVKTGNGIKEVRNRRVVIILK